ncbi:MAG TPA: hypothetical protein VJQ54_11430 [Candidatus Sulfotelmatobacter sp.]|nr:hypothetical protein [Candidatus Sulfotelmatobacter sp.]
MQKLWLLLSGRTCLVILCLMAFVPAVLAGKNFVKPVAKSATNYPAHDFHRDEQVAIAADPYDTPEKARIFSVNFAGYGLLPVFFVITNDGDQPVSIAKMEITLLTANHSKLTPIDTDDLYRRLANPHMNTRPSPLPLPNKVKGTGKKEMDEVSASQFEARAVEPHTTQSGFMFFDIGGISSPLSGANLDITGVTDAKGNELMFFEIPLDKYLNAPANP